MNLEYKTRVEASGQVSSEKLLVAVKQAYEGAQWYSDFLDATNKNYDEVGMRVVTDALGSAVKKLTSTESAASTPDHAEQDDAANLDETETRRDPLNQFVCGQVDEKSRQQQSHPQNGNKQAAVIDLE